MKPTASKTSKTNLRTSKSGKANSSSGGRTKGGGKKGRGKRRQPKLLSVTEEQLFQLAKTYTTVVLPDNKKFRRILVARFKPEEEPKSFRDLASGTKWRKTETLRRQRQVGNALKKYGEGEFAPNELPPADQNNSPLFRDEEAVPCQSSSGLGLGSGLDDG